MKIIYGIIMDVITKSLFKPTSIDNNGKITSGYNAHLIDALNYITENYNKKISINTIAKDIFVSRDYLHKLFVKNFNMSTSKFITKYRINMSLEFLANTDMSISEISDLTGFYDQFHFSHCFKKFLGLSPTEYRNKIISHNINILK